MFILQELFNSEDPNISSYFRYRKALKKIKLPFVIVKYKNSQINFVNPYTYEIIKEDSEQMWKAVTNVQFIPLGSVGFVDFMEKYPMNLLMGGTGITFENMGDFIPEEYILNKPIQVGFIDDLLPIADEFFIRPVEDNKVLNGKVFTEGEFFQLKRTWQELPNAEVIGKNKFIISEVQDLIAECQLHITEVTCSLNRSS